MFAYPIANLGKSICLHWKTDIIRKYLPRCQHFIVDISNKINFCTFTHSMFQTRISYSTISYIKCKQTDIIKKGRITTHKT